LHYRGYVKLREFRPGRDLLYGIYQRRIRRWLVGKDLPCHVAMIVDGNRRWAKQHAQASAAFGHRAGAAKILEFLSWCDDLGIAVVTLYLLSADNMAGRPDEELFELHKIIAELAEDLSAEDGWRIQHVGRTEGLPAELVTALAEAEKRTLDHTGLHVNLAVGYGGRREIADAMRSILRSHGKEGGTLEELAELLTPDLIADHLYTGGQPDPDLVIRTSGEQRISDFMLWQSAHSEFYFVEALYPDLREVDFLRAVRDYARRHRRYGS
jgi:short-chain Z-isoprenyl diphosphate synthase